MLKRGANSAACVLDGLRRPP